MLNKTARNQAIMRYRDKTYERIVLDVRKGTKDFYKSEAAKRGLSLAMLIQNSINEYLKNHQETENPAT